MDMKRVVFSVFAALALSFCLLHVASASTPDAPVVYDILDAFSSDERDWHTVIIDLGSSTLVRIYGTIVTEAFPTDVAVGVSEQLSHVSAWIGDSGGNQVVAAQAGNHAEGDRYLVIEGKAASADIAGEISVHFISYKVDGLSKVQFVDIPVLTKSAETASREGAGGCDAGPGLPVGAGILLALSALRRRLKRA